MTTVMTPNNRYLRRCPGRFRGVGIGSKAYQEQVANVEVLIYERRLKWPAGSCYVHLPDNGLKKATAGVATMPDSHLSLPVSPPLLDRGQGGFLIAS